MTMDQSLSKRQLREKEYYAQYAAKFDPNQKIDFSPVDGPLLGTERRPWNSYWRTYELPIDLVLKKEENTIEQNAKLLDFGCGPGDNALRFSRAGFKVSGFDISDENIKNATTLFEINNSEANFVASPSESLPFANEEFDVVVGIDILHHVDIEKSMIELKRILKKDGIAIFREPVEVPALDYIRNTALVKYFVPNSMSLENHITEDERKLNINDFKIITKVFPNTKIERSLVLSRFDKFFRKEGDKNSSPLEKADYYLNKVFPFWGSLGGGAVIIIKN